MFTATTFIAPAFTPKKIGGLVAWWDASQNITATGTDIETWEDLSGNGYYANADTGREPHLSQSIDDINGYDAVSFFRTGTGANNPWLRIEDTAGFGVGSTKTWVPADINNTRTIFIVGRTTTLTSGTWGAWLAQGDDGRRAVSVNFQQFPDGYINFATDNYANGGFKDTSQSYNNNEFYTACWGWSDWQLSQATPSTYGKLRVNGDGKTISSWGSAPSTPTENNPQMSMFIDDSDVNVDGAFISGDMAEMIIYDSFLSDADCAKVETYLQNKYGHY